MAALVSSFRQSLFNFSRNPAWISGLRTRSLSTKPPDEKSDDRLAEEEKRGWLSRFLHVRRIDPGTESHSQQLSDKDTVWEMQFHRVKPENMETYLQEYATFVDIVHNKGTGAELAGSFTVEIGDQDEALHIWKYAGGYPVLNNATYIYRTDKEFIQFRANRNKMLRSRQNQILLAFSFWGEIQPRIGSNIYELRSYTLKPGTMIEWGNNWAKGIKYRQEKNEAVAGFFSHIGNLYVAHHLWVYDDLIDRKQSREQAWGSEGWVKCVAKTAYEGLQTRQVARDMAWTKDGWNKCVGYTGYESLQSRKEVRDGAWRRPGWDDCVAHTVPLIRHMTTRILIPTPFSPLQ